MNLSRTMIALYVALALHLLLVLGTTLNPVPQTSPGLGIGLSQSGQGLDEIDQALAMRASALITPRAFGADFATESSFESRDSNNPLDADDPHSAYEWIDRPLLRQATQLGGGGDGSYFATLRAHLSGFRRELPGGLQFASAKVAFTVSADGQVSRLRLVQRSGLEMLDAEALDLIRRAAPLPKPPQGRPASLLVPVELGTR